MKKFKFKLESVLRFKTIVKEEKLRELLECKRALESIQQKMEQVEEELVQIERSLIEQNSEQLIYLYGLYKRRLQINLENIKEDLQKAEEEYKKALYFYQQAAKEEKSLKTLKEKKKEEYLEHLNKEEIKFLDELAVMRDKFKKMINKEDVV